MYNDQIYHKQADELLGKTLLEKGYSPDPFPKPLNDFYSMGNRFPIL